MLSSSFLFVQQAFIYSTLIFYFSSSLSCSVILSSPLPRCRLYPAVSTCTDLFLSASAYLFCAPISLCLSLCLSDPCLCSHSAHHTPLIDEQSFHPSFFLYIPHLSSQASSFYKLCSLSSFLFSLSLTVTVCKTSSDWWLMLLGGFITCCLSPHLKNSL